MLVGKARSLPKSRQFIVISQITFCNFSNIISWNILYVCPLKSFPAKCNVGGVRPGAYRRVVNLKLYKTSCQINFRNFSNIISWNILYKDILYVNNLAYPIQYLSHLAKMTNGRYYRNATCLILKISS